MRRTLADFVFVALLLTAVTLAAWLSTHWQVRADLSHGRRASLSPASVGALAALDGPVEAISYARDTPELRGSIAAFVGRYRQAKPDLSLRFVNPDADPGAMRERGITVDGEVELRRGQRTERLTQLSERDFTHALVRLARERDRVLALVTGHGERRADGEANQDLGRFCAGLADAGVRCVPLDFARQGEIPANSDAVVLAHPRVALAPAEAAAIRAWLDGGGNALWLAEPGDDAGAAAVAAATGVQLLPGIVVDAQGQGMGIGDPSFVAISHYPDHAIGRGLALTAVLPQAAALAARGDTAFAARPVLRSADRSWTESGDIADQIRYDVGGAEMPGPHDLALALTRLSPRPDRAEQRVLVVGDGDFLANAYLGNGGNRALGVRMVEWLVGDELLADVGTVEAPDRHLDLSTRALGWIGSGFLIGLPLVLFATGAWVMWRRRRG
jgi:ABC-type uncharacterized transport system involved in gliding motility auxiliary subunit